MKRLNPMLTTVLLAAALPAWAVEPAPAKAPVDTTHPQAVIAASAECSRRQDWLCLARLMDPAELKDLRDLMGEMVVGATSHRRSTGTFNGRTPEQLERLNDAEFFSAFTAGATREAGGSVSTTCR
ncbi:hypothetical protein [Lysobacter sp. Root983]|uniref:hypothetical protein n=1 Tax=Lysobacter sp. Root983 TaxID=1736613 RepID=UPI00070E201C|nr:hypothetical protein [Lysobacter sp. Root983]KRD80011.1 hypothetical protein ASE43_03750 [Lysobacter sp. Root983]